MVQFLLWFAIKKWIGFCLFGLPLLISIYFDLSPITSCSGRKIKDALNISPGRHYGGILMDVWAPSRISQAEPRHCVYSTLLRASLTLFFQSLPSVCDHRWGWESQVTTKWRAGELSALFAGISHLFITHSIFSSPVNKTFKTSTRGSSCSRTWSGYSTFFWLKTVTIVSYPSITACFRSKLDFQVVQLTARWWSVEFCSSLNPSIQNKRF